MSTIYISDNNGTRHTATKFYIGTSSGIQEAKKMYLGDSSGTPQLIYTSAFDFSYTGTWETSGDYAGNWTIKLLSSGVLTVKSSAGPVNIFMVGGGAGGSSASSSGSYGVTYGGAGGGGGSIVEFETTLDETNYSIIIGDGGSGTDPGSATNDQSGGEGGSTTGFGKTAFGGSSNGGGQGGSCDAGRGQLRVAGNGSGARWYLGAYYSGSGGGGVGAGLSGKLTVKPENEYAVPGSGSGRAGSGSGVRTIGEGGLKGGSAPANSGAGGGGGGAHNGGGGNGGSGIIIITNKP